MGREGPPPEGQLPSEAQESKAKQDTGDAGGVVVRPCGERKGQRGWTQPAGPGCGGAKRVLDFVTQAVTSGMVRAIVVVAGDGTHTVSPRVNRGERGKQRAWVTPATGHLDLSHQVGAGRGPVCSDPREGRAVRSRV